MKQYTIGEAKGKFSAVIKEALAGEEIIVAKGRGKKPLVRIVPVQEGDTHTPRKPGSAKHWGIWVSPDFNSTPAEFVPYLPDAKP